MTEDTAELDRLQAIYKDAVQNWLAAIQAEEALVSVTPHSVAEVDHWEHAHFKEEEVRAQVKDAKDAYEDALRTKFFGI